MTTEAKIAELERRLAAMTRRAEAAESDWQEAETALKEAREGLAGLLAFKLAAIHEPGKPYQGGLKQAVERARQALNPEPPHA